MMPRLIGATLVVGLAALIITTLFKLLLGITLLAGVITLISRRAGKRSQQWVTAGNQNIMGNNAGWNNQPAAFGSPVTKQSTIVPIN